MGSTVERGVLARVAAELLQIDSSDNTVTGLSSSGEFAGAYLNILRQSGLTRTQEVMKVFQGGVQRVAQLTVNEYEAEQQRIKDKAEAKAKRVAEEKEEEERLLAEAEAATELAESRPRKAYGGDDSITPYWDEDD